MKLTSTFKTEAGSRELPLQNSWDFPTQSEEAQRATLQKMAECVKQRMNHCSSILLNNNSGVCYNDGAYVVFEDRERFSQPAYKAMQEMLLTFKTIDSIYDMALEFTTPQCIQLIKAVGNDPELLNIAVETLLAVQQMERQEEEGYI